MNEFNTPPKINRKKYSAVSHMIVFNNLPYIFLLAFLGLLYIANIHFAEKKMRSAQVLRTELKELRWNYNTLKSEILGNSTQTQMAQKVSDYQISVQGNLPKKIKKAEN